MQRSYFFCWPYHVDIWQLHLTIDTYNSTFRFHVDSITVVSRWWIKRFSVFLGGFFVFVFVEFFSFFAGGEGGWIETVFLSIWQNTLRVGFFLYHIYIWQRYSYNVSCLCVKGHWSLKLGWELILAQSALDIGDWYQQVRLWNLVNVPAKVHDKRPSWIWVQKHLGPSVSVTFNFDQCVP